MTDIQDFPYPANAAVVFEQVRTLPAPVWLDSGKPRSLQGRFDIISAAPQYILETRDGITRTSGVNVTTTESTEDPFALAQQILDSIKQYRTLDDHRIASLPFTGGLIGSFGYQLDRMVAPVKTSIDVVDFPDMRLGLYLWGIIINHQTRQAWRIFHPACPAPLRAAVTALTGKDMLKKIHTGDPTGVSNFSLTDNFHASTDKATYLKSVSRIKSYIAAGDCYQVNYAQHFSTTYTGDPWSAYQYLRNVLPSPFSAYLEWEDRAVLSFSPERFLKVTGNNVETKPIKGTACRGQTVGEDEEAAIQLLNSSKDRAENLMIVDLLRNDIGRSCEPGSIRVPKLFALESFANVHHLVSTVTGRLRVDETSLRLLRNCFPGGSITGAPKKRAMEVITELETLNRSLYCGSIGYISSNGRMDTNIVIRTLLADSERMHCWSGSGIVADSDPETEYREVIAKVGILLDALKGFTPGKASY